jgi:hypothetical protein
MSKSANVNERKPLGFYLEPLAWILLATAALLLTRNFDISQPNFKLGPAFWPRAILIGIIVAALVLAMTKLFMRQSDPDEFVAMQVSRSDSKVSLQLLVIFALPLVYTYAIHMFGFYLITPVFVPVLMFALGLRSWRLLLFVTAGLYVGLVTLFVWLMFTPLPQGIGYFYTLNGILMGYVQ